MDFRFSLIDYTFNPSGDTTVIDEPNGWQNIAIKVKRDKKTHGIFFDVTANNLEFVGDGYSVIKSAYDDSGVFANTKILVEINCSENYRTLYEGRLRYEAIDFLFSDYCMAKVPIEQVGCLQTFINRQETEVDINAETTLEGTVVSNYPALSDEINLVNKPIQLIDAGIVEPNSTKVLGSGGTIRNHRHIPFLEISAEDFATFWALEENDLSTNPLSTFFGSANGTLQYEEILLTDEGCDVIQDVHFNVNMDIDVDLVVSFASPLTFWTCEITLYHTNAAGTALNFALLASTSGNYGASTSFNLSGSDTGTWSISNTDKLFFGVFWGSNAPALAVPTVTFNSGRFQAGLATECDTTTSRVAFINEVLSRNAELITDGCLRVYSDYFGRTDSLPYAHASDGCGSLEVIANGLQIRRATRTDGTEPKLFVNFKDLFDGLNAIHNIGMGIEEDTQGRDYMLRIEPVAYWYPYSIMHTVDLPMEVKISYDESRSYQTIQIGYDKWETEYSGGLDEFLTKREYRTELLTVDNKLEQVSKLIASGYAIEVTRRQGQTTEDFTYDNDIFIICLERGGYTGFEVEIVPLTAVNVLSTTNIYNVRISPVRNLIRWFKTIASGWTKLFSTDNKLLIFNSGEGNYIADLTNTAPDSCWVGDSIEENQDISKNTETDTTPLWESETIEFEYPLSWDDFLTIKADPKGLVQVNLTNSTIYGWIEEINYKPNEGLAVWKLLKAYDAEANI